MIVRYGNKKLGIDKGMRDSTISVQMCGPEKYRWQERDPQPLKIGEDYTGTQDKTLDGSECDDWGTNTVFAIEDD